MPAAVREVAASATPQPEPDVDGKCGWQHNYTSCLPVEGRSLCCSINGFCGSNATYCTDGCQENCWLDPSVLSTNAPTTTAAATSSPAPQGTTTPWTLTLTSTISSTTQSASPNTTTAQHHGLSGGARAGVIAGSTIGGLAFIGLFIACIIARRRGWRTAKSGRSSPGEDIAVSEAPAYHDGPIAPANIRLRNYGE